MLKGFQYQPTGRRTIKCSGTVICCRGEGHIVTGRLMGAPATNVKCTSGMQGKDIRVFGGQPKADTIYAFIRPE